MLYNFVKEHFAFTTVPAPLGQRKKFGKLSPGRRVDKRDLRRFRKKKVLNKRVIYYTL